MGLAWEGGAGRGRPLRVLFVAEQVLGHRAIVANLRRRLDAYDDLRVAWVSLDFPHVGPAGLRHLARRRWPLWGSARALASVLRAGVAAPPDVLVFHTPTVAQLAWPVMRSVPTVLSLDATPQGMHSLAHAYGHQVPGDTLYDRAVRRMNRAVFDAAAVCLPASRWAAESLRRDYGVPQTRIVVQPWGVDLAAWRPRTAPPPDAPGPPRLLFVGGDFRRKGGDLLLDVFRTGLSDRCRLDVVTQEDVPPQEGVSVHRAVPNSDPLRRLYAGAAVFVLPTRGDCFPTVAVEAMASGLPVVLGDVGGARDIVVDGETGLLIPPDDAGALRSALERLLADPALRRRMGAAGRRRAEARFDARDYAAGVHRAIRAAHAERRHAAAVAPAHVEERPPDGAQADRERCPAASVAQLHGGGGR